MEALRLVMRRAVEKAVSIKLKAKRQIIEKLHDAASTLSQLKINSLSAELDITEPITSRDIEIKDASFRRRYIELIIPRTPITRPIMLINLPNPCIFTLRNYAKGRT